MKERILEFLRKENKSSVHFAEEIGVQPSGISHILSGRNKPSLDFVVKMLQTYPFLSIEWLIFGKGSMYKEQKIPSLFDEPVPNSQEILPGFDLDSNTETVVQAEKPDEQESGSSLSPSDNNTALKRIIWFYTDNSFEEFSPRKV